MDCLVDMASPRLVSRDGLVLAVVDMENPMTPSELAAELEMLNKKASRGKWYGEIRTNERDSEDRLSISLYQARAARAALEGRGKEG